MKTEMNRTKKSRSYIKTKATGKYKRIKTISRGNTKYGNLLTKTFGTNRSIAKINGNKPGPAQVGAITKAQK